MGELPPILVAPPWLAAAPRRRAAAIVVTARAWPTTIRWFPGERERLAAEPARTLLALLARDEARAVPALLHALPDPEAFAALARVDAPEIAPAMAELLAGARTRRRARTWLRQHAGAAAAALVPAMLAASGAARSTLVRAIEALPVDVVRAEGAALGVADALAAAMTLDPLARRPARLPTLGPSIVVERLARPRTPDGAPIPDVALEHLVTLVLLSTPSDLHAGIEQVKPALLGLADFAWEAFEAWLAVGAPPKEDWPLTALAAFGDDEVVRRLAPRLRAWPGEGQGARAVRGLEVLAAIGTDVALFHLHGLAERGRYRALEEGARALVAELAEARGLSREELGDRLVPDLGLDPDGSCTLDFGARTLRVGFDEALAPFVRDAAGRRLAAFPRPTRADDPARAAAATARWRALRADAKAIAAAEIFRLERAMMHGRRWDAAAFRRWVVAHPLVGHLARRLVWGAHEPSGVVPFRVAEDRTLATVEDETFATDAPVGLVHPLELDAPARAAWRRLLEDYELLPPFPQLDRETFVATAEELASDESRRFVGGAISPRALFALEHRGWRRALAEGGGWVYELRRPLERPPGHPPLAAVLTFADDAGVSVLGGDDAPIPLGPLALRTAEGLGVPFRELGPVLFSEIVRDVARLRGAT